MNGGYDIIAVGELLIDLISTNFSEDLDGAATFRRLPGGSPANLASNMARLGNRAALVAAVGNDGMGDFLFHHAETTGLSTDYIRRVTDQPTTLILVTRSREVSAFQAYRCADAQLTAEQLNQALQQGTRLWHTTCFALSQEPARTHIMAAAQRAATSGAQLSIDANYAPQIWPDRQAAQETVLAYCQLGALVKISEVDWERLYGSPLAQPETAARHFLSLGASEVCITLGGEGCLVANAQEQHFLPARPVEVKDTTGAGDAFWAGYLTAWLDGKALLGRAKAGRRMAELKLAHFGPLPNQVERSTLYASSDT